MKHVAVIGAGFIGLASAAWLMREGHWVTLFDPTCVAQGASYGNAGTFAPYGCIPVNNPSVFGSLPHYLLSADSPFRLRWGTLPAMAPWLARFLCSSLPQAYENSAHALAALLGQAQVGYTPLLAEPALAQFVKPRECLYLYSSTASFRAAEPSLALRRELGVPFEVLSAAGIRTLEPNLAPMFERGVLFTGSWHFSNPSGFLHTLFDHLAPQGLMLVRQTVRAISPNANGATLHLEDSSTRAFDHVVVAAGARSRIFAKQCGDAVPLDTERGYHIRYPGAERLISRPVGWAERGFYMTPMQDGLRVAGTVELGGFSPTQNPALLELLTTSSKRALPGLEQPDSHWLGFRPTLPDGLPVLGVASANPRVVYAFGHQHLGLTLAGISGRIVADLIAERPSPVDLTPYRPTRF
ncbi:NAD(P)/FAD-dependent oxidoreductase [Ralstonia pickettii]|uniref:NAD(P)/FAD-dependent oxidoreductase n=1 Tax=Ralstonia pickettii TaxID=329 RepID=UPI00081890B6|nr:FAD-binding oxidoreductase [Ralstonia pickettii]OCS47009.1 amino acid dehydrogenase [Ralstonia pickettii]